MTMKTLKIGLLAAAVALTVGSAVTSTASAQGFRGHFGGMHFGGLHFGGGRFAGHWGGPRWAGFYGPRWGYRYRVVYPAVVYRAPCGCVVD